MGRCVCSVSVYQIVELFHSRVSHIVHLKCRVEANGEQYIKILYRTTKWVGQY